MEQKASAQGRGAGARPPSEPSPAEPLEMEPGEAIRWLVGFSSTDLAVIQRGRPGDLTNLLWDFRRYLNVVGPGPIDTELRRAEKNPSGVAPAIDVAKRLVEAMADGKRAEFRYDAGVFILNDPTKGKSLHHTKTLAGAVLWTAMDDFDFSTAVDRIKRCQKCNKVFVADRKDAIYCGRKCANLVAALAYQERRKAERARSAPKPSKRKGD